MLAMNSQCLSNESFMGQVLPEDGMANVATCIEERLRVMCPERSSVPVLPCQKSGNADLIRVSAPSVDETRGSTPAKGDIRHLLFIVELDLRFASVFETSKISFKPIVRKCAGLKELILDHKDDLGRELSEEVVTASSITQVKIPDHVHLFLPQIGLKLDNEFLCVDGYTTVLVSSFPLRLFLLNSQGNR